MLVGIVRRITSLFMSCFSSPIYAISTVTVDLLGMRPSVVENMSGVLSSNRPAGSPRDVAEWKSFLAISFGLTLPLKMVRFLMMQVNETTAQLLKSGNTYSVSPISSAKGFWKVWTSRVRKAEVPISMVIWTLSKGKERRLESGLCGALGEKWKADSSFRG